MNDTIFGKNSVLEALETNDRNINKVIISNNIHTDGKISKIKELCQKQGIVFQFLPKENFTQYSQYNHQGVIAHISPIKYLDLEEFLSKEHNNSSVVMLDGVEDAHNLGAIIRTCVCAGVEAVIIPSRRNIQVNSTVEKTSAGAINHIQIIKVNSPISALQQMQKNNWWVIAAEANAKDNYYDINYTDMNYVLVMGAEHAGVSQSIIKLSDFQVKIPMMNNFNSLNVSNALSAIIFESVRQKNIKKDK
ncbi:23S rRNA (guanosine(2251)-2'-O)-methyltransferase RlmB [bacterium]|nr:23S rRNA (guanosine(2251)-2'-O)-methyltransferase RlmB [bacterium]